MISYPNNNPLLVLARNCHILHGVNIGIKKIQCPWFPFSSVNVIIFIHLEGNRLSTIGTEGRRVPSISSVNHETVIFGRLVNIFECVGPGLECGGHAVVCVRVIFVSSDGDGGDLSAEA